MSLYTRLLKRLTSFFKTRDAQAMVEYALILALVSIVAIVALHFLGGSVSNQLNNIATNINGA